MWGQINYARDRGSLHAASLADQFFIIFFFFFLDLNFEFGLEFELVRG